MAVQTAEGKTRKVRPISETKPPKAIFKLVNPIMKIILRSSKGEIGDSLLLLTFTGRTSGKEFTTPVNYRRISDDTIVLNTDSPWYKNMLKGAQVEVVIKGKQLSGWAVATDNKDLIVRETAEHLHKHGLDSAREMGIMSLKFMPTEDELRVILRDRAKITIELGTEAPARRHKQTGVA